MRIEDFFVKKPELLQDEEVKNIISYIEAKVQEIKGSYEKYELFFDKANDIFFHSKLLMKNGINCTDSLKEIGRLINKHYEIY